MNAANLNEFFWHQSTDVTENSDLEYVRMVLSVSLFERTTMKAQQYNESINNEKSQIYDLKRHTQNIADAVAVIVH